MEKERLIGAVKELNESGLLEAKIRWVAVKQEALAEAFMVAVEQIPEADEEKIPDIVAEVYNELATGDESVTKPAPAPIEEKVDNKKKNVGTKKKTHGQGVIATIRDIVLHKGPVTKGDILIALVKLFPGREEQSLKSTINAQVPYRIQKELGVTVTCVDGKYSVKGA